MLSLPQSTGSLLISYMEGPNFRYTCHGRGVGASELDACGGDQSSNVGAYTWSSLRWFQSTECGCKRSSYAAPYLSGGLGVVWTSGLLVSVRYSLRQSLEALLCDLSFVCWKRL